MLMASTWRHLAKEDPDKMMRKDRLYISVASNVFARWRSSGLAKNVDVTMDVGEVGLI